MNPEEWQCLERLFHASLDLDPAERAAFLAQACAGDDKLRRRVEALLAALVEAGDFIEDSPVAAALAGNRLELHDPSRPLTSFIGRRLGHYEIVSWLGAGGRGEVYLARDLSLDRQIAVKILPAQFTQDIAQVRSFEREARAASALNHPNIITIHEIGQDEDTHFIATEFVAGQTLREKLTSGRLELKEALSVSIQIASALAAAHAAGVVHRDIKPENVMVRPEGLVKVLDFGLAKPMKRDPEPVPRPATTPATSRSDPCTLMGTIAYLSPEQVLRQEVDHRTDIFSLGVTLYEMVTGTRPFTGDSATEICDAILRNAPAPVPHAGAPRALKRIISRALETDRADRYPTADDMRHDLQQLLAEADGTGPAVTSGWRFKAGLGLGTLAVLAGLLALWLRRETAVEAVPFSVGPVTRITDMPGEEIYPSLSPDGQTIVFAGYASGNWDIYLQKIGERKAVNLTAGDRHFDFAPAFSPDGTRIAFLSSRAGHGICLMDRNGRNIRRLSPDGHNPAWSPDGREIALAEDRIIDYEGRNNPHSSLFAVNVATGARRLITAGDAVQPNWSPHGHRIAYWGVHKGAQRDIWTVPAAGGEPIAVTDDRAVDWNPVWSRDGRHIYFLSNRGGSMNLWRAAVDELSGRVNGPPEPATLPSANSQHLSFSADGRALAYVEMNRRENTYRLSFDPVTASLSGPPVQITQGVRRHNSPAVSPDEKSLVYVSGGETQEDVFVSSLEEAQLRQLTNDAAVDRTPRWSPDGRRIAFISDRSGKHEIWQVDPDGGGLEKLTDGHDTELRCPVWSPDGRRLLFQVNRVNSFIIEPGKPRATRAPQPLPGQPMPGFLPWSWSPDGRLLAGWQFLTERPSSTLVVYSFAERRYQRFAEPLQAFYPIWLNDSRRLLFAAMGKLYMVDILTRQWREIYNLEPNLLGFCTLSPDNRRLYYSLFSSEADIYLSVQP